jgi:hypothetical protein
MKNIENLDLSSVNRLFKGLKPLMIKPDYSSGKMIPNISPDIYSVILFEEENEIKNKCLEAAMTSNFNMIDIILFDLAEQKKEIDTLWSDGARFKYEIDGKDIYCDFDSRLGMEFIRVKLNHINCLMKYLNHLNPDKKKKVKLAIPGFESYLLDPSLSTLLIELFKDKCKPKQMVLIVFALIELNKLDKNILVLKPIDFSTIIKNTFGEVGSRQAIENHYTTYKEGIVNSKLYNKADKKAIEAAKSRVLFLLEPKLSVE